MAQRRLTINLPGSAETLHNVLQMLLQYGLISENIAHTIEQEETGKKTGKKSHWALAAEEMSQQGYLRGSGGELLESIRDFREGFEIQAPGIKQEKMKYLLDTKL